MTDVQSDAASMVVLSFSKDGATPRIDSLSASNAHSIARPDLTCEIAVIAEAATPARSEIISLIANSYNLRHSCSGPSRRKRHLSSFGISCIAGFFCITGLRIVVAAGGVGSLAALLAIVTQGDLTSFGLLGRARFGPSTGFVTLGAAVTVLDLWGGFLQGA